MNRFKELGNLKTNLMLKLIENDNIVKCLINNDTNFEDKDIPNGLDENGNPVFDRASLLYNQIFPYKTNTNILKDIKSFITMNFEFLNNSKGNELKVGKLYFFIIMHKDLLKTDYGILRYDYLMSQIDETFNATHGFGISKLRWERSYDFQTDNPCYLGVAIGYKNTDFQ